MAHAFRPVSAPLSVPSTDPSTPTAARSSSTSLAASHPNLLLDDDTDPRAHHPVAMLSAAGGGPLDPLLAGTAPAWNPDDDDDDLDADTRAAHAHAHAHAPRPDAAGPPPPPQQQYGGSMSPLTNSTATTGTTPLPHPASRTTVSTASVGTGGTGDATTDDTDPRTVLIGHARGMRHPALGDSTAELVPRRSATGILQRNASTPGFCCNIEVSLDNLKQSLLVAGEADGDRLLQVVDATKAHDGSGAAYTAYVVRYGDREVKRRYSEFDSLRKCLVKLYPALIVAPIPEKHSLAAYATKQARAKEDRPLIDRRKRLLQSFLNRVAWHPILSTEHLFHRFLEPGAVWSDVLHAAKVTTLPTSAVAAAAATSASSTTATTTTASLASSLLGLGATTAPSAAAVKHPDPKFVEAETFTLKFETHVKDVLERNHKRLVKKYLELASEYAELGALYNTFSLTEAPAMAKAIEKVGAALDAMTSSTALLCLQLDEFVGEPLHQYAQFAEVIKSVLRYRTEQQLALESTSDLIASKRAQLHQLAQADAEAQRITDALRASPDPSPPPPVLATTPPTGLMARVGARLTAMMDADPEATRRQNIAKARDVLTLLEAQREKQANALVQAAAATAHDLERFQRQKVRDLARVVREMARLHVEYCRKNLHAWQDAKKELSHIPTVFDE
ncbi:Sorting nexin, cytoplasm-to-vacuole targeting pathway/endosomal sorting [Allomyces javanicus]|nr:Sorting nexin, cytoplasm-to-vacuole targeting pathway/endosomal sorting [Allomyces javanicus]